MREFWIRDPFRAPPVQGELDTPIADALRGRIQGLKTGERILIATPVSGQKRVIDAKPIARCRACGTRLWVSPCSLQELNGGAVPVCQTCINSVLKQLGRKCL